MTDESSISETAQLVLASIQNHPARNTPPLIAQHEGLEREETETALAELLDAGLVRHTAMGWKLPRK